MNMPLLTAHQKDQDAWSGSDCSAPSCLSPEKGIGEGIPCAGNGECILEDGLPKCQCRPGWLKNSTMCNEPAEGQTVPLKVDPASIFSSEGYSLMSKGVPGASASTSPNALGLGKYQMFFFEIPEKHSAVSINVSAYMSDHAREFHPNRGRPDFLVAATQETGLEPTFGNLDLDRFDYNSWAARQMDSHLTMIRSSRDNELWYVTVLSTTYARADLDYKIHIQGTTPSDNAGGCSRLSWAYKTCGGGKGECSVLSDTGSVCTCGKDTNKAEFRYVGPTCGTTLWPIPQQSATATDEEKKLPASANLTSGSDFSSPSGPLEPGEWVYFELDTRNTYGSLSISMTVLNPKDEIASGVVSPLMLVKSSDGGARLPALDPDQDTLYDISGARSGVQTITIEGGKTGSDIANGYYIGVYNQLHSRSALKFSLRVISVSLADTVLPTCATSPCVKGHTKSDCVDDPEKGRTCACSEAWKGTTCSLPTLRSTVSLLKAATNILALGNNDNQTVSMERDDFRFFKIPQPLKIGQGVRIKVCDASVGSSDRLSSSSPAKTDRRQRRLSQECPPSGKIDGCCCGDSCSDPDIYLATQLPRSAYDFGQIRASPNGSSEVLTVYNTSSSGRYYLAVYANYKADFLVEAKLTAPPASGPRATDKFFFELLGIWLTTDTAGIIVLIVICTLTGILCAGCFCTACCSHENLHNSEAGTTWAGTFGRIIGSSSQYVGKPPPPPGPDPKARVSATTAARAQAGRQLEVEMTSRDNRRPRSSVPPGRTNSSRDIYNPYSRGRRSMI